MYIVFDDAGTDGDMILRGSAPGPATRAENWIPANYRPKSDGAHVLANERRYVFEPLGKQYGASFEVRRIAMVEIADRLIAHLLNGGTCELYLEDTPNASYTNCGLMPDSTPTLTLSDPVNVEYTLAVALINSDGDPMTAHYGVA